MTEYMEKEIKNGKSGAKRFMHIIDGSFLTREGLRAQYKVIALGVVLLIVYIANHYIVQQKLTRIDRLKQELKEVRYETLLQESFLMQESRQSHVERLVEQRGLDLHVADQPPYSIRIKPERHGWK